METGKHTPGPWIIDSEPSQRWTIYGATRRIVKLVGHTDPETIANAALIAAAPDLLRASRLLIKSITESEHDVDGPTADAIEKLMDAIDKTTKI